MVYPELLFYPSSYSTLSKELVSYFVAWSREYHLPGDIYANYPENAEYRVRIELNNLCSQGIINKYPKGYLLAIGVEHAKSLIAFKETPTQRAIIAHIRRKGLVFARQFQRSGKGDSTQFLRAARVLESIGIIESELTVPYPPRIKRRVYTIKKSALNPYYSGSANKKRS